MFQTYELTDGQEIFQYRIMTPRQAERENAIIKQATDTNIYWQPAAKEPQTEIFVNQLSPGCELWQGGKIIASTKITPVSTQDLHEWIAQFVSLPETLTVNYLNGHSTTYPL